MKKENTEDVSRGVLCLCVDETSFGEMLWAYRQSRLLGYPDHTEKSDNLSVCHDVSRRRRK